MKSHILVKVKQEVLDFGMDKQAMEEEGIMNGLKVGSRAEKAGLREGDRILRSSYAWKCVDDFEEMIEVVVLREGKEKRLKWWPRSWEQVESWQMVKVENA
jgi:hypothetical protein